ncbi:MAG: vitamin B12 dependent-methionine synthase activation domain-containing protein [Armatimonadota bacterium]
MPEDRNVTYDPLVAFMALFENVQAVSSQQDSFEGLGIEERLKLHIVNGIKKKLDGHLAEAMETYTPLQIINDILLDGMKTVGELFGAGKMQLPFVLQSAEVMKTAVAYLEPHMEKVEGSEKGSILLATVAGDVHDIGKNLVDIILSNNGYRVENIGIKQPIQTILEEAQRRNCDVIGLSGLLVKSTLVMRDNLLEMNARGLAHIPVILGGAALTRAYVEEDLRAQYHGNVFYAQDAFEGLHLMGEIKEGNTEDATPRVSQRVVSHRLPDRDPELYVFTGVRSEIEPVAPPTLPFYGVQKRTKFDIFELYKYINPIALWRGQWQFKRRADQTNAEFNAWLEENVRPIYERKQRELANVMKPAVKWGYFWAQSEGNDLIIYHEDQRTERARFQFPRQRDGKRQCLADFFQPVSSGIMDVAAFHIVTVGGDVSEHERALFANGDYAEYLYTHGMGVETAEALAEYWHQMIRREMGIDDAEPEDMRLLFSAKYHGSRYSFGYPACPNLEDQRILMELLEPQDIGITLSEEDMLVPEQSTSAIIVHHPEAKYFNIR